MKAFLDTEEKTHSQNGQHLLAPCPDTRKPKRKAVLLACLPHLLVSLFVLSLLLSSLTDIKLQLLRPSNTHQRPAIPPGSLRLQIHSGTAKASSVRDFAAIEGSQLLQHADSHFLLLILLIGDITLILFLNAEPSKMHLEN